MMIIEKRPSKTIFFSVKEFFPWILISKMDVKMNLRMITKNHAADSKIGSPLKIDFRANWTHESNPTALELRSLKDHHLIIILNQVFNFSNYRQISSNSGKIFRENFQICRSISKLLLSSDQNVRVNTSGYRCLFFTIVRSTYNGVFYVVTWNISENLIGVGKIFNLP